MIKEGDKVKCSFIPAEKDIIRTAVSVQNLDGKVCISCDGGPICPECNTPSGTPISLILNTWYTKYER